MPGRATKRVQLGLTGWVRNEGDGSVSAPIAGTSKATLVLERFWDGHPVRVAAPLIRRRSLWTELQIIS